MNQNSRKTSERETCRIHGLVITDEISCRICEADSRSWQRKNDAERPQAFRKCAEKLFQYLEESRLPALRGSDLTSALEPDLIYQKLRKVFSKEESED